MADDPSAEYRVAILGQNLSFQNASENTEMIRLNFYQDKNIYANKFAFFTGTSKDI